MQLSDLNQLVDTMGLLNRLADKRELDRDKCSRAVLALADCLGVQHYNAENADIMRQVLGPLTAPVEQTV